MFSEKTSDYYNITVHSFGVINSLQNAWCNNKDNFLKLLIFYNFHSISTEQTQFTLLYVPYIL